MTLPASSSANPLRNRAFARLFAAQILSLTGIGLMTVGLALLALRLGGPESVGGILGLIFALKMVAYVGIAPLAEIVTARIAPGRALVGLDLVRMGLVLPMVFATHWGHVALLTFLFFAASAAFTPLFQSLIPEILDNEATYSRALAWSRAASTLETVISPLLAGLALIFFAPHWLFVLAALCLAGSVVALLLARPERLPGDPVPKAPFLRRLTKGLTIYIHTPRLRGLFVFNLALSLMLSWVLVNSVGFAAFRADEIERFYPILMAAYGLGAAIGALPVPRLLERVSERRLMAMGTFAFAALSPLPLLDPPLAAILPLWAGFGAATSLVLTPGGLVLTRSAGRGDRPAVFAAQFSASHAGWLVAYPLAGWLGQTVGLAPALAILGGLGAVTALLGLRIWPAADPVVRPHAHSQLQDDHPHFARNPADGPNHRHSHAFHIDEAHPRWSM